MREHWIGRKLLGTVWLAIALASGLAAPQTLADDPTARPTIELFDNLYLDGNAGFEKPPGEDSTGAASFGANWGIPLTPPGGGLALALQASSSFKEREDDPEWNSTVGVFSRNFPTIGNQKGAAAVLFDFERTSYKKDLWVVRPIFGTTISPQDALGAVLIRPIKGVRGQWAIREFRTFWTRNWNERLGSEVGIGYQTTHIGEVVLHTRLAYGLTRHVDCGVGADVNESGNYAVAMRISYHFGGNWRHDILDNIGGAGSELYTPFPDTSFPMLLHRTK